MENVALGAARQARPSPAECVPISDVIDRWVVRDDNSRFSDIELDDTGFGFDDKHRGAWCAKGCRFFVNSADTVTWYTLQGSKMWRVNSPMRDPIGKRSFYERLIFRMRDGKRLELKFDLTKNVDGWISYRSVRTRILSGAMTRDSRATSTDLSKCLDGRY